MASPPAPPPPAELSPLVALYQAGHYSEAENNTCLLLERYPSFGFGWKLLGACLERQGKEVLPAFQHAVQCLPLDAEARNNLGFALHELGRFAEAEASCRRAIALRPNFAEAYNNLGNALNDSGQASEALVCYQKAISIKSNFVEAHHNLGNALNMLGRTNDAILSYRHALQFAPDFGIVHSDLLFSMGYTAQSTPGDYLAEALRFGAMVDKNVTTKFSTWQCEPHPPKLRVGIASGDLCSHPVGYFTESLLGQLNSLSIELIAYTNNPGEDDLTAHIRPHFSQWREVFSLNDPATAQLIHKDGVHVLLDLSGHTAKNRLPVFAWKPAPVQATWLGYFASTGVAEIDYLLADAHMVPSIDESHFTETIWRLPSSYLCFTPPDVELTVEPIPALSTGQITFGCFNNLTKVNDAVIALWARVLLAIPNSRLFLKTLQLNDVGVCDTTRQKFAAQGVTGDRLCLEGSSPRAELLAAYQRVDIALDPFPYPGGTTTCEALWMGVPMLTKRGDRFLSHMGESILHNAGLPDWIAQDEDDYVAKAIQFAGDLPKLAALRAGLREQVL
ncbi:MAG: tetratricopeptide repeat protein, partial [Gallionella sp.]|nr:tetratricopeptide repeat protein [Gallionella sp.]